MSVTVLENPTDSPCETCSDGVLGAFSSYSTIPTGRGPR
jgi:hypothetical protein